jgi:hypothetical protein
MQWWLTRVPLYTSAQKRLATTGLMCSVSQLKFTKITTNNSFNILMSYNSKLSVIRPNTATISLYFSFTKYLAKNIYSKGNWNKCATKKSTPHHDDLLIITKNWDGRRKKKTFSIMLQLRTFHSLFSWDALKMKFQFCDYSTFWLSCECDLC